MIQEFKFQNFLSFRDETTISFEPVKEDKFNRVATMPDGTQLLRFAVVFGANASGKSNLLKAFEFLRDFWTTVPSRNDTKIRVIPFLLDDESRNSSTKFELKFYIDGEKYWYKVELDRDKVLGEALYCYFGNSVQPTRIFNRTFEDGRSVVKFNPAAVKLKAAETEAVNINCWKNMSLFASLSRVNMSIEPVDKVVNWIERQVLPVVTRNTELSSFAKGKLLKDKKFREYLIAFAKKADFNIDEVKVQERRIALTKEHLDFIRNASFIEDENKTEILNSGTLSDIETEFLIKVIGSDGEKHYSLPENLQSEGTTRMMEIESTIFTSLEGNAFLPVDEVEASMHSSLLDFILNEFLKDEDSEAQLLVTTHYDPLLKKINDLFGKDSVWFTDKGDDGSTELYPLTDFNGLNKLNSVHKAYLNGQFGAIPEIFI